MHTDNIIFQAVSISSPLLSHVISDSIGSPTTEKIAQAIKSYEQPNQYLIGAYLKQNLIAVIGFEFKSENATIRHISVLKKFRQQGVGNQLLQHVIKSFKLNEVRAETDDESVGFYKVLGFVCKPFHSSYGIRYFCRRAVKSKLPLKGSSQ